MREYVIMTDSCCDLTDHMAKELGLAVVPLTVHIDGHDYPNMLDGSAISFEDFYGKIRSGVLATTSAANVGQFQEAMRPILAEGKDIVSINFSSALSTTYQSACIAAQDMKEEFPDANIYVVDSLSASLGQGLLLYLAAHKKQEGLSAQELVQWVEDNKLHIDHWFTVDDLNYLKMGGRLSAGAAFFGSMLSIKPVMHTSDEGKLVPVSKVRGRKASLKALIDKIAGHRAQRAGDVHLPRRLRGGGPRRGRGDEGALRREGGLYQLHRAGDRQPHGAEHHGSVLRGHPEITTTQEGAAWNGWS